jgi:hypothetical protein
MRVLSGDQVGRLACPLVREQLVSLTARLMFEVLEHSLEMTNPSAKRIRSRSVTNHNAQSVGHNEQEMSAPITAPRHHHAKT